MSPRWDLGVGADDDNDDLDTLYGAQVRLRRPSPFEMTDAEVVEEACRLLGRLRTDLVTRLREVLGSPRARRTHELKTWPGQYQAIVEGRKTHEVRRDDRDFRVGDRLWLQEFHPETRHLSGRGCLVEVTYITRPEDHSGVTPGHCVMTVRLVDDVRPVPLPR